MVEEIDDWREVADSMRRAGRPAAEIAAICGVTLKHLLRYESGCYGDGVPDESELTEPHSYRVPKQKLAGPEAKAAILRRYLDGEIDRKEMSRQLWLEAA